MVDKQITNLATMLGSDDMVIIKGQEYGIRPLGMREVQEIINDNVSLGPQLFSLIDKESREKLEKWIPRLVFKGEVPMSLTDLEKDDWSIIDLKKVICKVCDLSG